MRVYLLNPPYIPRFTRDMRWQDTGRAGTLYYPIWLAYATGVLEQVGCEVRLADTAASGWTMDQVLSDIGEFEPDLVVVDTSFPSLNNDISIAETIKESHPEAKIAMVGAPCSQFASKMLTSPAVDIVCRWEFDFTLRELAQVLDDGNGLGQVKGISYKNGVEIIHNPDREPSNPEALDKIPFVSEVYQKHLNIRDYLLNYALHPEVQIFTGRGCPFQCTFCSWPQTLMGRKYRARSISNVLDEIEWVGGNLPEIRQVFLEDDTFTVDKRRVLGFCQGYKERHLKIPWGAQTRADIDYETMKAMREANCLMIDVGYECGSDVILKNVKKGVTIERIRQFALDAKRAGLPVHGNWIIGLPGETKETIEMTERLIKVTNADAITVAVTTPFPGTELYEWARTNEYLLTDDPNEYLDEQGHQKAIISYPELSSVEITRAVDRILKGYYLSPSYIPIALRRVFRRHGWDELKIMWRSAKAFLRYIADRQGEQRCQQSLERS